MSKRFSTMGKPEKHSKSASDSLINPYETAKRKSALEKQRKEMYQRHNSPRVIIKDDPVIPSYSIVNSKGKHAKYNMKIVVVGDGGCGKTCLLVSYAQQKFPELYVPTIFENYVMEVASPSGYTIELALWDTAGQEEYDRLRPLSYPDVDILLICFSLDNLTSLQNVKDIWFPEVSHFCPGIPVILVGTKSDVQKTLDPDVAILVATEINAIGYISCSAKEMFNITTVFNFALNHFQKLMEYEEQLSKSLRKRLSMGFGHSRNSSQSSAKRMHHKKNSSLGSSVLLDGPLTEDNYEANPYSMPENRYNEDEFSFTRKERKKSKRCVIL